MRVRSTGGSTVGMIILLAFGLTFAGAGGYFYLEQKQDLEDHQPVDATVVSTSVHEEVDDTGTPDVDYYGVVVYEYEVDGQTYRSSNLYPGNVNESRDSRRDAEAFVQKYPPGKQVTAYYDPADPSEAYLIERESSVPLLIGGFGGLMVLIAVVQGFASALGRGSDNA